MLESLKKIESLFGTSVPEEAIRVFWETVCELLYLLPEGWKVTHSCLFGCCSNAGGERLIGATVPMVKMVIIDVGQLCSSLRMSRVPKSGTLKFTIWHWIFKTILKIFIRHEFRHANQFEYLAKHGVPWFAAMLAESHTPYLDQVVEKDAISFQYFGIGKSLNKAMAPIIKMVRG